MSGFFKSQLFSDTPETGRTSSTSYHPNMLALGCSSSVGILSQLPALQRREMNDGEEEGGGGDGWSWRGTRVGKGGQQKLYR